MSSIKQRCKRVVAVASSKTGRRFVYQRPVAKNDRKREGRNLVISDGCSTVILDGHGLRQLKQLLRDCGEYGRKVNSKRTKIVVLQPLKIAVDSCCTKFQPVQVVEG